MTHHMADADLAQAVDASYGRLVRGAPPPAGSVTIAAATEADFLDQFHALFDGEDAGAADHPGAPGADPDPGPARG